MAPGTLTMALLLLAPGANPPDIVPMNLRNFQIPIHINEGQRSKIKELILFSSSDEGATWHQAAVASPDKEAFVFYAPSDGVYWFNVCVVDQQGNREPADIYKSAPRQKVLVDTLNPSVRITMAEREGDEIVVAWEIQEEHPDLSTFKLEYRTPDIPAWMWYTAPVAPAMSGKARFRFASSAPVSLRLQMADQAGNVGNGQALVQVKNAAGGSAAALTASSNSAPNPSSNVNPNVAPTASSNLLSASPAAPLSPAINTTSSTSPPPASTSATAAAPAIDGSQPVRPVSLAADAKSVSERSWTPVGTSGNQQVAAYADAPSPSTANVANPGSTAPAPAAPRWPYNGGTPLQITNSTQVNLDYEVTKVGPSGVGSVELYLTQDEGRSWQRYADDPDLKPPMSVNLPGEGVYGLRLVVGSRAGLGKRPPQSGDLPQMRIEVDTTPPVAKLFYPQPDPHRRDALVLTWNATDHNLAPNPITLQWAERPDGAWQTIAADLPNTGRYTWQLSPNLPYRVYLRLTARDTAGNSGVDETPEPVLIDLHEPEGQLLGIVGHARHP